MHAGVVSVQFKPDKVEEAVRIYQDSVVSELRQMRGFKGGYGLTNAEKGKGYIIGLSSSPAALASTLALVTAYQAPAGAQGLRGEAQVGAGSTAFVWVQAA